MTVTQSALELHVVHSKTLSCQSELCAYSNKKSYSKRKLISVISANAMENIFDYVDGHYVDIIDIGPIKISLCCSGGEQW